MAKEYPNSKKFLLIEMTMGDAIIANFGYDTAIGRVLFDCCTNEEIFDDFIYVACLNDVMSKDNIDSWIERTTHYEDYNDVRIEKRNYNYYAEMFNLPLK